MYLDKYNFPIVISFHAAYYFEEHLVSHYLCMTVCLECNESSILQTV